MIGIVGLIASVGLGILMTFSPPPFRRSIEHVSNQLFPNELLSISQLIEARIRNKVSHDFYLSECKKYGLNKERAEMMLEVAHPLLTAREYQEAYWRGAISEAEFNKKLKEIGFTDEEIKAFKAIQKPIPSVSDVIMFAVREVYSPEAIRKFRLDEGYEEVFKVAQEDLKNLGMTKELLRKYWIAHWRLPSVEQGYEMLHRGVISMDELKLLLRMQDINPFWQDKLIKISYAPYTRVDVRRMHKLGVLSDKDLIKAYKDLGYDEEHARALARFTIEYNKRVIETEDDKEVSELKGLSKSRILNDFYRERITEKQARDLLKRMGLKDTVIDFYIESVKYEKLEEQIKDEIELIHKKYIMRAISDTEAQVRLNKLMLTQREIESLMQKWDFEREIRERKPTKADLTDWLMLGIINVDEFVNEMRVLGYDDKYIYYYIEELIKRLEQKKKK